MQLERTELVKEHDSADSFETPLQPTKRRRRIISSSTNSAYAYSSPQKEVKLVDSVKKGLTRLRRSDQVPEPVFAAPRNKLEANTLRQRLAAKKKSRDAPGQRKRTQYMPITVTKKVKRIKKSMGDGNPFFDHEADVSMSDGEGGQIELDDESDFDNDSELDKDLSGFIASSQTPCNDSPMEAVYLQSIQSQAVDAAEVERNAKSLKYYYHGSPRSDSTGSLEDFVVESPDLSAMDLRAVSCKKDTPSKPQGNQLDATSGPPFGQFQQGKGRLLSAPIQNSESPGLIAQKSAPKNQFGAVMPSLRITQFAHSMDQDSSSKPRQGATQPLAVSGRPLEQIIPGTVERPPTIQASGFSRSGTSGFAKSVVKRLGPRKFTTSSV